MSTKTPTKPKAKTKTVKPNGNRLFIRPITETVSEGGIILPPQASTMREVCRAEVVEVGDGMYTHEGKRITMAFKKGDVILYPRHCGNEVQIGTEKFLIVTEPDVLGIERDE